MPGAHTAAVAASLLFSDADMESNIITSVEQNSAAVDTTPQQSLATQASSIEVPTGAPSSEAPQHSNASSDINTVVDAVNTSAPLQPSTETASQSQAPLVPAAEVPSTSSPLPQQVLPSSADITGIGASDPSDQTSVPASGPLEQAVSAPVQVPSEPHPSAPDALTNRAEAATDSASSIPATQSETRDTPPTLHANADSVAATPSVIKASNIVIKDVMPSEFHTEASGVPPNPPSASTTEPAGAPGEVVSTAETVSLPASSLAAELDNQTTEAASEMPAPVPSTQPADGAPGATVPDKALSQATEPAGSSVPHQRDDAPDATSSSSSLLTSAGAPAFSSGVSELAATSSAPVPSAAATTAIEAGTLDLGAATEPAEPNVQRQTFEADSSESANKDLQKPSASTDSQANTNQGTAFSGSMPDPQKGSESEPVDAAASLETKIDTSGAVTADAVAAADVTATTSSPATRDKTAAPAVPSAGPSSTSKPSTPVREGRVALILRINKELIRFCVELQGKELTSDPLYREAAVRLQANLAFLAMMADKTGKSVDPSRPSPPSGTLPRLAPFPRSEHAPSSPIPALYDKLIALFGEARQADSPSADSRRRSRDSTADLSNDHPRKRTASKGIDRSQNASAASSPSSSSFQQTGANAASATQPADTPDTPAAQVPNTDSTPAPMLSSQPPQQQSQSQSQPQPQPPQQQQGRIPDLSLAPPVPIAASAAAQNIPNNPQAQALMQAFGPNALVNLHALQSHLRGQGTHPWVRFMEASVIGFKAMPLQVQLQHMTSLQNAALQRQKSLQGGDGPSSASSTTGIGSPASMQTANGGMGAASSPAATRPVSRHSDSPSQAQASPSASGFGTNLHGQTPGRAGTPSAFPKRPGSSGSVGSMTSTGGRNRTGSSQLAFDASQMQSEASPPTMASMPNFAAPQQGGGNVPNFGMQPFGLQQPFASTAPSPGQHGQFQQAQQQPGPPGMAPDMMMGMNTNLPNFQNLPPHLQQQIRQQYMAHMQAQSQAQGINAQQQPPQPQQQQGWNFQSPQ